MERHAYLAASTVLLPFVLFFSFSEVWEISDFWETAAAVRELAAHPWEPTHHLLRLPGESSPRFTPYTLFWGLVQRWIGSPTLLTMGMAGLANALLFLTGLYRFLARRYDSRTLPAYMLVLMLWVWGSGYGWANAYHLEAFLLNLPYVGFFAFALSLHALHYLDRHLAGDGSRGALVYAALAVLVFVTHPITGAFCFVAAAALLLESGGMARLLRLQAIPAVALLACLAWPYFDYAEVLAGGVKEPWFESALFSQQYRRLGMALVGLPVALHFAWHRRHTFVVLGLACCSAIYLVSGAAGILIGGRFLLYGAFFLHLALALFLMEQGALAPRRLAVSWRGDAVLMLLVFAIFLPTLRGRLDEIRKHAGRIVDPPFRFHRYEGPVASYRFLAARLTEEDTVIADGPQRYFVTALTGARVVVPYTNLLVPDARQRRDDVSALFAPGTRESGRRAVIERYGATHLLELDAGDHDAGRDSALDALCPLLERNGPVILRRCPRRAATRP